MTHTTISSTAANEIVWIPMGLFNRLIALSNVARTGKAEKPKPEPIE
jgi:hypothetical protein